MRSDWHKPKGMTLSELLIGVAIFSVILGMAFTLISRWMNISRTADYRLQAIDSGRKAMMAIAEDIRRAEYIVTNHTIALNPAPPAPYPNYDEFGAGNPIPIVVQNLGNASAKHISLLGRAKDELKTNSIVLVCSDAAGDDEIKTYIVYYAKRYQEGDQMHVGLFRYEFPDTTADYRFNSAIQTLEPAPVASALTLGEPSAPYPPSPSPYPSPTTRRLVDSLFFKHDPDYCNNYTDGAYLFRIMNPHPYSNDNWMSPFYVEVEINVGYAKRVLQTINLANYLSGTSIDYTKIPYDPTSKANSEVQSVTLKTVALAKGVLMPK